MRIISLLTAFAAHWHAVRVRRVATRELAAMSVCELSDMGTIRLDVSRLFEPRLMPEFRCAVAPVALRLPGRSDRCRRDRQP